MTTSGETANESSASRNSVSRAQRLAKRSEEELRLKTASAKGHKHSEAINTPTTRPGAQDMSNDFDLRAIQTERKSRREATNTPTRRPGAQAEKKIEPFAVARTSRSSARSKDRKARRHDEDRKSKGRAKSLSKPKPGVQYMNNDFDLRAIQAERKSRRATPEDVIQRQRDQRSAREVHAQVVAGEDGKKQPQQTREQLQQIVEEHQQQLEERLQEREPELILERKRKKRQNLCILGGVAVIAVIVTAVIILGGVADIAVIVTAVMLVMGSAIQESCLPNPGGSNETVLDQISVPTIPPVGFLTPAPTTRTASTTRLQQRGFNNEASN